MASSSVVNCDICDKDHVTKPAKGYCSQCDEALCTDCKKHHKLSKATKSHETITIDEFQRLPSFIRKIKQTCEEHGNPLEFFCPIHDELCCKLCIIHLLHKSCNETVFIPEMVKSTDLFSQLDDFRKITDDAVQNLKLSIADRQNNLADIEQQRLAIIHEVKRKKEEIINHLDKLEQELLQSLPITYKNIKLKNEKLVAEMESKSQEAVALKEEINAIQKHASDVQLFMGSKQLMKPVTSLKNYIKSTVENGSLDRTRLVLDTSKQINNITDIRSFGTVSSTNNPSTVKFNWKEEQHAQTTSLKKRTVRYINLELKQTLKIENVGACIILSDENIIVGREISSSKSIIIKYTLKGQLISDLGIKDSHCYDLVSVNENNVAVTSGNYYKNIHIINVNTLKVVKVIKCDDRNYGATFHDGSLICCTKSQGIRCIDIETEKCTTIISGKFKQTNIVSDDNYLYHSDHRTNSVVCYDFKGKTKWTYKSELLKYPCGITIDRNSNVFVAGYQSNNVLVISSDGKHGRQLLCASDNICIPTSVHINKERNVLLVKNKEDSVYLYYLKV